MKALKILYLAILITSLWVFVANIVFMFRHPWATDTERLMNIKSIMLFQKVPYEQMRPRQ